MSAYCRAGRRCLIVSIGVAIALSTYAQDGESFTIAHLTDPHLFDAGSEAARQDNFAAFRWAVSEINGMKSRPMFVAVTGDLGIEGIVDGPELPHTNRCCPSAKRDAPPLTDALKRRLIAAADELAAEIRRSDVEVWVFVPGNNDVWQEKSANLEYYEYFMAALRRALTGFEVLDLNMRWIKWGPYLFAGIDNSSFKNNDSHRCSVLNASEQSRAVHRLASWIDTIGDSSLYLLYHIPEIDDPYLQMTEAGEKFAGRSEHQYPYSAWLVDDESVRDVWQIGIVDDPRVKALLAGHFHSDEKGRYRSLSWAKGYPSTVYNKLAVAPPLAEKFQGGTKTARGFQILTLRPDAPFERVIYWYRSRGSSREAVCVALLVTLLVVGIAAHVVVDRRRRRALAACLELNEEAPAGVQHE